MVEPKEREFFEEENPKEQSNVRDFNTGEPKDEMKDEPKEEAPVYTSEDIEKNKVIAALAYLIFFLPLLAAQDSPYGRYHANQGLLLFILGFGGNTILTIIPIIGWLLIPFFSLFVVILAIMGILNALNGKTKELPIIGQYRLLK